MECQFQQRQREREQHQQSVGPQYGDPVTNALPGCSWHQWNEAVDLFWVIDGKAEWSSKKKIMLQDGSSVNGYV
ncbi:hypothetical protein U14_00443 [Candidatus Moduliflexus flocculans]|uniref:Uncharacterized protein n=1 Tax=Candidatus Moduliflexus flocculans TaxID=1499966 RepID=A0A0S6VPY4_9BACT|nr:hypothetical protein U14_00443 [Candidatus Moduliflexus flocculans]